nr:tRNA pseudouridine(55) synthase TruB [Coleofasciculus sp. LEGE 07081]
MNLNKPAGFTSHDCVAKVRRLLRLKRVGHGGTLDPAATGVLPIALGKATRLLQYMQSGKAYQATIRLGVKTTTDDLEGEIVATYSAPNLTLETVLPLLAQFKGKIEQVPPMYSAIQVKGKRLYDLARAGETVEVPKRTVDVYQIDVLDWRPGEFPELDVAIACGSGTYIRAIARDLGESLTIGGTLASLTRTQSSGFQLEDSLTLEELENQIKIGTFTPTPPEGALRHLTTITLPANDARRWCQGQKILYPQADLSANPLQVYSEEGSFLGIGRFVDSGTDMRVIPLVVLEAS